MKQLVFLGSNHNLRQMADIADMLGYEVMGIVDQDYFGNTDYICNIPVIGNELTWDKKDYVYFNAVNYNPLASHQRNNAKRQQLQELASEKQLTCINLIHPAAIVAPTVRLGHNIMICAGAIVSNYATLNSYCQIREQSYIAHNAVIGAGAVVQVQGYVGSEIVVGDNAYIGIKGTVISGKDSTYKLPVNSFVRSCTRCIV